MSGRIRTARFNNKRKSLDESSSSSLESSTSSDSSNGSFHPVSPRGMTEKRCDDVNLVQVGTEEDYNRLMEETRKEVEKKSPSRSHVKNLVRESFGYRRQEVEKMDKGGVPMVSTILEDWPCFEYGEYVSIYTRYMSK